METHNTYSGSRYHCFIFYPILAFGNYQYIGPAGAGFAGFQPYDPSKDYQDPFNPNTPPQA